MTLSAPGLGGLAALLFLGGAVDSVAGGGGLITLPAYLAFGVDPALLLGTNKLSSSIGTSSSAARYRRELRLPLAPLLPALAATCAGAALGARLALRLDPSWIRPLLVVLLPGVAAALLSHPHWGDEDRVRPASRPALRAAATGLALGTYDGFFGPGTGTFLALALARLCGYGLLGATGRAKLLNLASNLTALAAFLWAGRVDWRLGLAMGAANAAGNLAGSRLGVRRGAALIRPALAAVCAGLCAKLAWDWLR